MLLAALGPLCAQGAERVQGGVALSALAEPQPKSFRIWQFHESEKYLEKYHLADPANLVRHAGGVMNWVYNDSNRPAGVSSAAAALAQINASMARWTAVCNINFSYQGTNNSAPFSLTTTGTIDGVNVIGWVTSGLTAPTTGITNIAWYEPGYTIADAEIRLNANYSSTYSPASFFDATLTHEIGHAIGIQHSNLAGNVMSGTPESAYSNGLAALQLDDIAACRALYGPPGGPLPTPGTSDTQAPSVPTGLTATVVSSSAINVVWTASTDSVGVTGYKVFGNGTLLGTVPSAGASVTGLTASSMYSFTVSACDAAGNCSAQSAPVSATTQAAGPPPDTQSPTVPTGLMATVVSSSAINLAWTASTDNVAVTGYRVFRSGTQIGTVTSTGAAVTGLAASTMYSFTASACDAAGNCSVQSAAVSATTQSAAPPPCAGPQPPNDQQTLSCPPGQTGSIIQQRPYTCVAPNWTPGAFQTTSNTCMGSADAPISYQGVWGGGPAEDGWGLALTQHDLTLVAGWYYYDGTGRATWTIMPGCSWNTALTACTGSLLNSTGAWFGNYSLAPFLQSNVGSATFSFTDVNNGTMSYVVNGVSGQKTISRLNFVSGTAPSSINYTDIWWGGASQGGWGVALSQQQAVLVGSWYTYDSQGRPIWFVMNSGSWTSASTYQGNLIRATGSPLLGTSYNSAAFLSVPAGPITINFSDANNASMTYTVDGVTQTKSISRFAF